VLSEKELHSRFEIYNEAYEKTIEIEAGVALTMAKTMIAPAAMTAQGELASSIKSILSAGGTATGAKTTLKAMCAETEKLFKAIAVLEKAKGAGKQIAAMDKVRAAADALETMVPEDLWPLPSYAEMMFMM
jgi:glutamine synthetase